MCASSYTSCSNGVCSGAPAVQLVGGVSVPGWGGTTNVDDAYLAVTVPFAISMYGYSTTTPSVQSNGVSLSFFDIYKNTKILIFSVFVLVVVVQHIRIPHYHHQVFLVQQHLVIGMIYIFILEHLKQFIMVQLEQLQIEI